MDTTTIFTLPGNGVLSWPSLQQDLPVLYEIASLMGFKCYIINADQVPDKKGFLETMSATCELPDYFGFNWDALEECLRDFSFAPASGYIFGIIHAKKLQQSLGSEYDTFTAIFLNAADQWEKEGIVFKLLLDHEE